MSADLIGVDEELPEWGSPGTALWQRTMSWHDNLSAGPAFRGRLPARSDRRRRPVADFLQGRFSLASPVGIPAGPLLCAAYTELAGRLGFDVLTYKTIRSRPAPGHGLPNIVYVDSEHALAGGALQRGEPLRTLSLTGDDEHEQLRDACGRHVGNLSITNSFGMPSKDAAYLLDDIARAVATLDDGQLLIVSVTATPGDGNQQQSFVDDLLAVARLAVAAGAPVIEVNLSCPNVCTGEGSLYTDADKSAELIATLVQTLADDAAGAAAPPVIVKVGVYADDTALRRFLRAMAAAGAAGVCGINTLSARVVDHDGRPALGPDRPTSGICGAVIRQAALHFVRTAAQCIAAENLPLELIACGGVATPDDIDAMLDAGARVVTAGTAAMWDPYLAARWHRQS